MRLQLTVERVAVLIELGRLAEATAAAEQGVELARLAGNPPMLLWARCALSVGAARGRRRRRRVQHAEEAAASGVAADFHAAGPARLGARRRARRGGEKDARASSCCAEAEVLAGRPPRRSPRTWRRREGRTRGGPFPRHRRPSPPPVLRLRRAAARSPTAPPRIAALPRGRSGVRTRFGAQRRRDEAVRELRRLGHRVRARPAAEPTGPRPPASARSRTLVAAGRTNREVAAQLVLSERTIEAHLRNVYAKLGVRSRVELTRRVTE